VTSRNQKRRRIRFDHRHNGSDVGRVAQPHLTANRAALYIRCHTYRLLIQIGGMILAVAAPADALSSLAFKVERSGVEKDQLHFSERILSALKECLLDEVFVAPHRQASAGIAAASAVSEEFRQILKLWKAQSLIVRG
jgi:hypothetical protein